MRSDRGRGSARDWGDRWPLAVHVTVASALPTIREHGLRPASYWVTRAADLTDTERTELLERPRHAARWLEQPSGDHIWLRDQQPLLRGSLEESLVEGVDVRAFLRHVNDHVFFFPTAEGAGTFVERYRPLGEQAVLHFDTRTLLEAVGDRVALTAQNTGSIGRDRRRYKGPHQFIPLHEWSSERRPREIAVAAPGLPPELVEACLIDITRVAAA